MRLSYVSAIMVLLVTFACGRPGAPAEAEEDALVTVGDSTLRLADVVRRIPTGLDSEDSLRMFHNIVSSWVDGLVLSNVAQRNIPDMRRIDRMVQEYRNNLIISEYTVSYTHLRAHET